MSGDQSEGRKCEWGPKARDESEGVSLFQFFTLIPVHIVKSY
nr:MAG TPA: hypothetical protein [Caudoviricetes sp.]